MTRADKLQISEILRETDLLGASSDAQRADLTRTARNLYPNSGETIFRKGSIGTSMYLVVSGRVKFISPNRLGIDQLFAVKEAGDVIGELALAGPFPRSANCKAFGVCHLLEFDCQDVLRVLRSNPDCMMAYIERLLRSLRESSQNLAMIGRHDARKRLWLKLMLLAQLHGVRNPKTRQLEISHGFSQQDLADSIGMTRVMVNRQLGLWREAGWVETNRGMIRILNPEGLEALVWGDSLLDLNDSR